MPKLPDLKLFVVDDAGERHSVSVPCSVTATGDFVVLPELELYEAVKARLDPLREHNSPVRIAVVRGKAAVTARTLDHLKTALLQGIRDVVNPRIEKELVIRYSYKPGVSYWRNADGTPQPNGESSWADDYTAGGGWAKIGDQYHSRNKPLGLSVMLWADVMHKTRIIRGEHVETRFERPSSTDLGYHGQRLRAFVVAEPSHDIHEMPYSEAAAEFFVGAMLSICALAERMKTFFGAPDEVKALIDRGISFAGRITGPAPAAGNPTGEEDPSRAEQSAQE